MVKLAIKTDESASDAVVTARWIWMGPLRAPTQSCGTRVTGVRTGGMRECRVHLCSPLRRGLSHNSVGLLVLVCVIILFLR